MAFNDDMIEAGYSDEQEYLDSLIDDFENKYSRQLEREMQYNDYSDSSYDKEEEREKQKKREIEKQWVSDWKTNNPDLAIIWQEYYQNREYMAKLSGYIQVREYYALKNWLNKRKRFENERQKKQWTFYFEDLFSLYKDELFNLYFPKEFELINTALITQEASELSSIEIYEPSLWKFVFSRYKVEPKFLETVEDDAFWEEVYKHDMDYEYWKDCNSEQYDQFAKQWIANSADYVYGKWMRENEKDEIEWKKKNQELFDKYKRNYEVRERNKLIESTVNKVNSGRRKRRYILLDEFSNDELDFGGTKEPFLPDFESREEVPFDINSLSKEQQDSIASLDMSDISKESSKYADKVLDQLWLYTNRDEWEMNEIKERYDYLFRSWNKYSKDLLLWWKNKYPTKWNDFLKTDFQIFKKNFEIVIKFRLWSLDNHKEEFIKLADRYLPYWKKTIKLMYGQDIHEQLCYYSYNQIGHSTDFWGEDIDYIKNITSIEEEVQIWQKELRDKVIWEFFFKNNYSDRLGLKHIFLDDMYMSLYPNNEYTH